MLIELIAVPDVKHNTCCVLVLRIPGPYHGAVTALNFSEEKIQESIALDSLLERDGRKQSVGRITDAVTGNSVRSEQGGLTIDLPPYSFKTLVIERAGR